MLYLYPFLRLTTFHPSHLISSIKPDNAQYLRILLLACTLFFSSDPINAQCGDPTWELNNDCGDIQASGGLAANQPTIFCEGQTVIVENNSSPAAQITQTFIDWGDGTCQQFNGCPTSMTHIYDFPNDTCIGNASGQITFPVRLGVQKTCGNTASFNFNTFPIAVKFKPVANISANPQAACISSEVDFTFTGCENSNNPTYSWNMGNGQTFNTEHVPNYVYPAGGTYTVTMTVSNSCGTDEAVGTISVLPPATAVAAISAAQICAGETVTLTNSSTNANGYQWTITPFTGVQFVTPSNSTSANPVIRFNTPGTYSLTLRVIGCGNPEWVTNVVVLAPPAINLAPVSDQCGNAAVVSIQPTGTISGTTPSVSWSFPGGSPASFLGANPGTISYSGQGTYIITATANNACNTVMVSDTFSILPLATAVVAVADDTLCSPTETLVITNSSSNAFNNAPWQWSITPTSGFSYINGTSASSAQPQLIFDTEGSYRLHLAVNGCGMPEWDTTVVVRLAPQVQITPVADGCIDVALNPLDYVQFSGGIPTAVTWTFGGATPSTAIGMMPPMVNFTGYGQHFITVQALNQCQTVVISDTFNIIQPEVVSVVDVGTFCSSDEPLLLQGSPSGGTWSGPGVDGGGIFNPAEALLNVPSTLIYQIGTATCAVYDTLEVLVRGTLTNAGADQPVCANAGWLTLSGGTPSGGVWSGNAVTPGGNFDPVTAGSGAHTLTYSYTDTSSGCVNSDSMTVTVEGVPAASLDSIGRTCVNEAIDLTSFGGGNGGGNTCIWDFGDGNTASICNPIHIYTSPGNFTLTLQIENSAGCRDTATAPIQVVTPPNAIFISDTTQGCADLPVLLTNNSAINDYTLYIWNYGNGQIDTLPQPGTIVFTQGETDTTYQITLTAQNGCGTATDQHSVTVFPRPQVRFGTDVSSGCTPLEVNFNNVSVGDPDYFNWYINNMYVGSDFQLPQQVFLTIQHDSTYYIALEAGNECGLDTVTHTVLVKPNPVTAFFNTDTLIGCQPFQVRLIDYSTEGLYISWDLGDGTLATGDTVIHIFSAPGQYTIQEFVNNGCGFDTSTVKITVLPAPEVSFTHLPYVCVFDTLSFTNTSPAVTGSYWDFGDGTTDSTLTSVGHSYHIPGQYTVQMTGLAVTTGCPATTTSTVEVKALPEPAIALPDSFGCQPFSLQPINSTSGGPLFYVWNFGDGTTGVTSSGSHLYTLPGQYTMSVQITDFWGCRNSQTFNNIQVFPRPIPDFSFNPVEQCVTPATLNFTNESSDADAWMWQFGTLGSSNVMNPVVEVPTAGTIPVKLFAQNQYGCADSILRSVAIYTQPLADFSVSENIGCQPFAVHFDNLSQGVNQFHWNFGDGTSSSESTPLHIYQNPGIYPVSLYVSTDSICFDSVHWDNFITVQPAPHADFTFEAVNDTTIIPNGMIRFFDTSSNALRWHWDFGDGDTSNTRNPIHRYYSNGAHTVLLIVYNILGCPDTAKMDIIPDFFGGLYIPNSLSPESGNSGEREFKAVGLGLIEYELSVYSTYGELVWQSTALQNGQPSEGWNGRLHNKGDLLPQGIYWWKARARFENGRIWRGMSYDNAPPVNEGKVLLIR